MPASTARDLHLARQPILDRSQALVGFELLFRAGPETSARFSDPRAATAEVILNAFLDLGVEKVLGRHRGFINVDLDMFLSDSLLLLPKERVVIELLETIPVNAEVIERARELSRLGYMLALDDVVAADRVEELLPITSIVKIDVLGIPREELGLVVAGFRERTARGRARPLRLLAEKVETREQMHACRALGFDLFQGYYFARPELLTGQGVDRSKLMIVRLLSLVQKEPDTEQIEAEVRHHPQVVYDLMRLANSARLGLAEKADSLRRAIVVLGQRQIRRWVQLLVYSAGGATASTKPGMSPLMHLAATRARLMERLAELEAPYDRKLHEQSFMTGIVSLLDVLLEMPLAEVVESLDPVTDVRRALLRREGQLGRLLALVEKLETGDRPAIRKALLGSRKLDEQQLVLAEIEALRWASEIEEAAA